jgi:hypothetical protein
MTARLYLDERNLLALGLNQPNIHTLRKLTEFANALSRLGAAEESLGQKQPLDSLLSSLSALADPGGDKMLFWDDSAGQLGWLEAADALAIDGTDLDASGGGSWALHDTWTFSTNVTEVDFTGLTGSEVMIVVRNLTLSVSTVVGMRCSVNNGSSYYSASGDYVSVLENGTEGNTAAVALAWTTNATGARSGMMTLAPINVNGALKVGESANQGTATQRIRYFVASTSPVNAVRIFPSAGGNITGGSIYCFTR